MKKDGRAGGKWPAPKDKAPRKNLSSDRRDSKYAEVLGHLYGLQTSGIKLGLQNMQGLLSALGNPEASFKCIHVAGTNGKGSTSAAIASILGAAGKKTGLFTSPHLLSFTERMKMDGREVEAGRVVDLAAQVKEAQKDKNISPTFFEFVTAMALLWFRQEGAQWAVLETGLGGRLDSTNVVVPEVSVITTVGVDHKEFLGGTLGEIAAEKAGIIKKGVPVVLGPQRPEALEVLEERFFSVNGGPGSAAAGLFLFLHGREFSSSLAESSPRGVSFDYQGTSFSAKDLFFPLAGDYQAINASVAAQAATVALPGGDFDPSDFLHIVRSGLGRTSLPGRLELIESSPEVRLDGAHNPDAAQALAGALKKSFLTPGRRLILVLGIMGDKDVDGILSALLPLTAGSGGLAIFTAPAYGRAARPEELQRRAGALGFFKEKDLVASPLALALRKARDLAHPGDLVVVTGSFYTAGEAKELLTGEGGKFSRLRESR